MNDRLVWYILSAVGRFYEKIGNVEQVVTGWASEDGVPLRKEQIQTTLEILIRDGLVESWLLASDSSGNCRVTYDPNELELMWFYITPRGKELLELLTKRLSNAE